MSFHDETIVNDPKFRSVDAVRDVQLLEPVTRQAIASIIAEAKDAYGIDLLVTETYRSVERQQHLLATGATQIKDVGVHHYGLAADFCKIIEGKLRGTATGRFCGISR
jgi:hypothetical protein